jgi:lipoate-protein ligase B
MARFQSEFLRQISYAEGLQAQERALEQVEAHGDLAGHLLGLEHRAVVTLGKRGRVEDDLRVSERELSARGLELFISERGGQATLHSPGQLVIYPCVSLKAIGLGPRDYVRRVEALTQEFLALLGIETTPNPEEPGLYTSRGKIAFFGFKIARDMASHGLAINVSNDLSLFDVIRSCGKERETFDQISRYRKTDLESLLQTWAAHFSATFRV